RSAAPQPWDRARYSRETSWLRHQSRCRTAQRWKADCWHELPRSVWTPIPLRCLTRQVQAISAAKHLNKHPQRKATTTKTTSIKTEKYTMTKTLALCIDDNASQAGMNGTKRILT